MNTSTNLGTAESFGEPVKSSVVPLSAPYSPGRTYRYATKNSLPPYALNTDGTVFHGPGSTKLMPAHMVTTHFDDEYECCHAQGMHPEWRTPANPPAPSPGNGSFNCKWTTEVPFDTKANYTADMWVFTIDSNTGKKNRYLSTIAPCTACPCVPPHSTHRCSKCKLYGHRDTNCRQHGSNP